MCGDEVYKMISSGRVALRREGVGGPDAHFSTAATTAVRLRSHRLRTRRTPPHRPQHLSPQDTDTQAYGGGDYKDGLCNVQQPFLWPNQP